MGDASIGNVVGSNSVNVFLGLGLPWTLGAIYWSIGEPNARWKTLYLEDPDIPDIWKSGAFIVKSGSIAFSVMVFSCCALACISVLYPRRTLYGGELGGPRSAKVLTSIFLIALWTLYVSLSSWYSMSNS